MQLCSFSTASIMLVTYGIEVIDSDDKYIAAAETAVGNVSEAFRPGAFLVDTIPACASSQEVIVIV